MQCHCLIMLIIMTAFLCFLPRVLPEQSLVSTRFDSLKEVGGTRQITNSSFSHL